MKIIVGTDIGGYAFNKTARTITLTGLDPVKKQQLLLITNVKTGTIIYQFDSLLGSIIGNVITLDYDTSAMTNTDELQIFIDYQTQKTIAQIPAIAIAKKTVIATVVGSTMIHTPSLGKRIRLFAFGYSASGSVDTGNIKAQWRFGSGAYLDTQFLTGNQGYAKSPGNGKFCYEGAIDEALFLNLDATATIAMNIDYEEI